MSDKSEVTNKDSKANEKSQVDEKKMKSDSNSDAKASDKDNPSPSTEDAVFRDPAEIAEELDKESSINSQDDDKDKEELQKQLDAAIEISDKNWEELLRTKAELDNAQKRAEKDVEKAHKFAVEKFVQELLPVTDSLEMGISAANDEGADIAKLKEGAELTLKMFADVLSKFGVEVVNPVDEAFNPEFHQAMSMQETADKKPNTVLAVMQKGCLLNGRLVRPAMVVVSKAVAAAKPKDPELEKGEDKDKVGTNFDEKA